MRTRLMTTAALGGAFVATAVSGCGSRDRELAIDLGRGVTMKMVLTPAGTFTMGSPVSEAMRDDDEVQHEVTISKPFYMGATEVTVGQFRRFVTDSSYRTDAEKEGWAYARKGTSWGRVDGASWKNPGFARTDDHPVVCVSHNDAVAFCRWLSGKVSGTVRLPTEAEWEYACRAGTQTPFHTGATISTDEANYDGNLVYGNGRKGVYRQKTMPVGSFKPNAWGLYDMHGNVWEWCEDWFGDYPRGRVTDPTGPGNGTSRVLRGGSWFNYPRYCRSANGVGSTPGDRSSSLGFRVSRTVLPSAP